MKVSVSLPNDDLEFLDRYAVEHGSSRSGALQRAVQLLRREDLGDQYEQAWAETDDAWGATDADGLDRP